MGMFCERKFETIRELQNSNKDLSVLVKGQPAA
jgi:hypothetical protein